MIPAFSETPFHAAWTASRPLAGAARDVDDGRKLSRDFLAIDHGRSDGLSGFISVIGGKATVLRAMAEKTVDMVCDLFGVEERCRTAELPLLPHRAMYTAAAGERARPSAATGDGTPGEAGDASVWKGDVR